MELKPLELKIPRAKATTSSDAHQTPGPAVDRSEKIPRRTSAAPRQPMTGTLFVIKNMWYVFPFISLLKHICFDVKKTTLKPKKKTPVCCYSWRLLGRSRAVLGCLWPLLGALGALLGCSRALMGRSWPLLGRSWGALGALLGRSWALLGRSWALLGPLGRLLGPLGALLGGPKCIKN